MVVMDFLKFVMDAGTVGATMKGKPLCLAGTTPLTVPTYAPKTTTVEVTHAHLLRASGMLCSRRPRDTTDTSYLSLSRSSGRI